MRSARIQLENHEFEGDNTVYLLESAGETALVDTGVATDGVRRQLEDGLSAEGVEVEDVDRVLVTHWHADHAGLTGWVQRRSGAEVLVHVDDASLVRQEESGWREMEALRDRLFEEWGIPEEPREELVSFLEGWASILDDPPEVTEVVDEDTVRVGDEEVEVLHTPGHTSGHCCLAVDDALYSGDAVLPVYTPNVGGADVRTERPLDRYVDSLNRIEERGFSVAYPGHRDTIDSPAERAREIVEHHRERAGRIVDVLDERGPSTAWEVGAELFGDLSGIHIMHGPGESYAHLDHMERHGVVELTGSDPVEYELAVDTDTAVGLLDDTVGRNPQ